MQAKFSYSHENISQKHFYSDKITLLNQVGNKFKI